MRDLPGAKKTVAQGRDQPAPLFAKAGLELEVHFLAVDDDAPGRRQDKGPHLDGAGEVNGDSGALRLGDEAQVGGNGRKSRP